MIRRRKYLETSNRCNEITIATTTQKKAQHALQSYQFKLKTLKDQLSAAVDQQKVDGCVTPLQHKITNRFIVGGRLTDGRCNKNRHSNMCATIYRDGFLSLPLHSLSRLADYRNSLLTLE